MSAGGLFDAVIGASIGYTLLKTALLVGGAVRHAARGPTGDGHPSITVVIPAYNEEAVIAATVRSVADAAKGAKVVQILVVDDGSTDATAARLAELTDVPLLLARSVRPNRGKAHALASACAEATGEIVVTVDADTRLAPDALARIVAPFSDPEIAAVAGNVKVGNRDGWLGVWQSIEYVGALNIDRRGQAALGCMTTVPGAFGAWRTSVIHAHGGFSGDTLAEDTDLTLTVGMSGGRIAYAADAIAFTEAPTTWGGLFRQRTRWLRGNLQCLGKHAPRWGSATGAYRWFALPDFAWKHLLAFLMVPLSLLWLPRAIETLTPPGLGGLAGGLYGLDLALMALAYRLDRERWRELVQVPVQRLVFPLFLVGVFAGVAWRVARGMPPVWGRARA